MQLIPIAPRDFRIISACLIAKYIFSFPEKSLIARLFSAPAVLELRDRKCLLAY